MMNVERALLGLPLLVRIIKSKKGATYGRGVGLTGTLMDDEMARECSRKFPPKHYHVGTNEPGLGYRCVAEIEILP